MYLWWVRTILLIDDDDDDGFDDGDDEEYDCWGACDGFWLNPALSFHTIDTNDVLLVLLLFFILNDTIDDNIIININITNSGLIFNKQ